MKTKPIRKFDILRVLTSCSADCYSFQPITSHWPTAQTCTVFLRSALYVQVALPQLLGAEANEKALVAELGCRFLLHVR